MKIGKSELPPLLKGGGPRQRWRDSSPADGRGRPSLRANSIHIVLTVGAIHESPVKLQ